MDLLPAIDILDGKAVRLAKGDSNAVTVYNDDPAAQAQLFEDLGQPISPEKKFKVLVGHTPLQVVCGAILGIAVGCALMQI